MSKNVLAGLAILLASGFATWLFLPAVNQPAPETPPLEPVIVQIGPIQFNAMLFVLFFAAGVPIMGLAMAVVLRWLGQFVPAGASTPAPASTPRKPQPPAPAAQATAQPDLPLVQKAIWWLAMLVAIGAIVVLLWQVLPPDFMLF